MTSTPTPPCLSSSPSPLLPTHCLHQLHAHWTLSGDPPSKGLGPQLPVEAMGQENTAPGKGHTAYVKQLCPP